MCVQTYTGKDVDDLNCIAGIYAGSAAFNSNTGTGGIDGGYRHGSQA